MVNIETIESEILKCLRGAIPATYEEPALLVGTHNANFGNRQKAQTFLSVYREMLLCHHLLAWQEVDQEFLQIVVDSGEHYVACCTEANSRGQAIGFTVHKRLQIVDTRIHTEIQDIGNIADLRPALRLDLRDTTTGLMLTAVVVHYKSNYGGVRAARGVRYQQATIHAESICTDEEFTICLGDFNQILEVDSDADPLIERGYHLMPRHNRSSTHTGGSRLDGMFVKNVPIHVKITGYKIRNFWRNNKIGCALSDHGLLSWKIVSRRSD
ncbi:hypothetical protein BH10CYA1_BH10CYA1_54800 [soil metagenome]